VTPEALLDLFLLSPVGLVEVDESGRVEVAKFDWSEDVKVTNSAACVRLNISAT